MYPQIHTTQCITQKEIDAISQALDAASRLLIVMDKNTQMASGNTLIDVLKLDKNITLIQTHCFEAGITPHIQHCHQLSTLCSDHHIDAIIAVGSGTINDLCKYTAFLLNVPYVVCATAPSMNGYVSGNASIITESGYKTTLKAKPPVAVICDMSVIASAPMRLLQAGFGDAICRSTAQVDWLFSHLLLGTPYDDAPFVLTRDSEPMLITSAERLYQRDAHAVGLLMQNLLDSGKGMTIAGGSYPASQGEHMLAHGMEMAHHHTPHIAPRTPSFHGEEIAVTTLFMAHHHAQLLASDTPPRLCFTATPAAALTQLFGQEVATSCLDDYAIKTTHMGEINTLQHHLDTHWHEIRNTLRAIHIPPCELRTALTFIHAPTTPETLGWSDSLWQSTCAIARFTRDRFTMLDVQLFT